MGRRGATKCGLSDSSFHLVFQSACGGNASGARQCRAARPGRRGPKRLVEHLSKTHALEGDRGHETLIGREVMTLDWQTLGSRA